MTREEFEQYAIENGLVVWSKEMSEKAIKALGQEPSYNSIKTELNDCISRQAVLNTLDTADKFLDEDRTVEHYKALLKEAYEVLPPVKPKEPKTGQWVWCGGSHRCSNCGEYTCFSHKEMLRYCPNCGAKMESEDEE